MHIDVEALWELDVDEFTLWSGWHTRNRCGDFSAQQYCRMSCGELHTETLGHPMTDSTDSWLDAAPAPIDENGARPRKARKERAPKPPKAEKPERTRAPRPSRNGVTTAEADPDTVKTWRPKFLQYNKNNKKGEIAEAVRSLGMMLATSRGETLPLETLSKQYAGTELGVAFGRMYEGVQSGSTTLAQAFRDEQKIFPQIVGDLVFVGSRSGNTAGNLEKAADILESGHDLTQKIRSALVQPAVLLAMIIAFLYAVILFVLPVFKDMFASFGRPLPPLSQAIMAAGSGIAWGGGAIALLVIAWVVYYRVWGSKNPALRIRIGRFQLRLPVVGAVLRSQKLTQVFSVLSGLLSVGMSERDALEVAADASGNWAVRDLITQHMEKMDRGVSAFADIADGVIIPFQAGFMLRNGFDSGAEVKALEDLTRVYQRDASKRADNLTQALEPIANGLVGIIFFFVIVATYLPVYDLFSGLTAV